MESIAAERLNKIGKNPSMVSQREDLQTDLNAVNEILILSNAYAQAQQAHDNRPREEDEESPSGHGLFSKKVLPRPKSESCFKMMQELVNLPALAAGSSIASAGVQSSLHRGGTTSLGASGASTIGSGTANIKEQETESTTQVPSSGTTPSLLLQPKESSSTAPVKESKSSFNLHSLLR